jgi:hypothetical protein
MLTSILAKSQIEVIPVLIGKPESVVVKYMDSLNSLKNNPYYRISRSTNSFGDLQLTSSFSMADQSFYKCLSLIFIFQRIKGTEICSQQFFYGDAQYASYNLNYIKDNFKQVGDKWEYPFYNIPEYKIVAEYTKKDGNPGVVGGSSDIYRIFYYVFKNDTVNK